MNSGGVTNGGLHFEVRKWGSIEPPLKFNTMLIRAIIECLYVKVGGKHVELLLVRPIRDKVHCHGNKSVIPFGIYHVGEKRELWVVAQYVVSPTGFVKSPLLFNNMFHAWDFLGDIWINMNE